MMRRRLFNLWTPRSCTTTIPTSDSPFMEDYSSEDYDDDDYNDDMVPNSDPIIACNEEIAPEVPNAVEPEEGQVPIASLPLPIPIPMVETSLLEATVPPFHESPEYLSMEMFLSSAALFLLQECRTSIKSWTKRFLSELERLRNRFYNVVRTLIRKPFVWASRKKD